MLGPPRHQNPVATDAITQEPAATSATGDGGGHRTACDRRDLVSLLEPRSSFSLSGVWAAECMRQEGGQGALNPVVAVSASLGRVM